MTGVRTTRKPRPEPASPVLRTYIERLRRLGVTNESVLDAFGQVPRHLFLDQAHAVYAYDDMAIPIGAGQTISKPSTVGRMLELLVEDVKPGEKLGKVLEVGTGCGYQASVLAKLAKEVYSVERIKSLHEQTRENIRPLHLKNLRLVYGDGGAGLPKAAPFDGIIIAAACPDIPQALLSQLAVGGRIVAPVGDARQAIHVVKREGSNFWQRWVLEECRFVPLLDGTE